MLELRFIIYLGTFILLNTQEGKPILETYEDKVLQIKIDPDLQKLRQSPEFKTWSLLSGT